MRSGDAFKQMSAEGHRATDVMAHERRAVETPVFDEIGQRLAVGDQRHVLVDMAFGVPEAEQVPDIDLVGLGELGRDVSPHERATRSSVREHHGGTLTKTVPSDLTTTRLRSLT